MRLKILIGFLFVAAGILIGYALRYPIFHFAKPWQSPASETQSSPNAPPKSQPVVAVAVENLPEARPQYGLSLADFVMETVTEGGITRFLAFYGAKDASQIGPVRSARPYFLDWALGFDVPFAHSGGSKEALDRIKAGTGNIKDLDEFFNEKSFWRDPKKKPPHNLFTSTMLLRELLAKKGWTNSAGTASWAIKKDNPTGEGGNPIKEISINFSSDPYALRYLYDSATNSYKRLLAGKPQIDALTNAPITAKNVVILYTTSTVIDPELLTIDLQTLGSERAMIFRDGGMLQARWKKDSPADPLKLLDADGSLVPLNGGPTWIEIIDQNGTASWK